MAKKDGGADNAEVIEETATQEPQSFVYCGPNLKGGVLAQFTTFKNELPLHVKELVEKCPAIGKAIIPAKNLSTFIKKAADKTTVEFAVVDEIVKTYK